MLAENAEKSCGEEFCRETCDSIGIKNESEIVQKEKKIHWKPKFDERQTFSS